MNDWYPRMIAILQLNGKGEPTQKAYTRAVRMLSEFYEKTPDLVSEPELQEYFLHRKNVNRWAPKTMRICYCGIRFFYVNVLSRDWHILSILRAQNEHRLPAVLSVDEVRSILAQVKNFPHHVFLSTVYSCGLRLDEARHLEVSDIDSQRMMVHVHRGKGAKDRYVALPQPTLHLLRQYWLTHRHPRLVFPARGHKKNDPHQATQPVAKSSVQSAFRQAKRAGRRQQKGRGGPHPAPFLCHPSPRSRRQSARHPTLPRPLPTRNHHALSSLDPEGPGRCLPDHQSRHGGTRS